MPKVSVIIPVYKVERYLPACLDSVLAQTFQDWEAICVNDGSPDGCDKILEKYAKKDKRIKVITQANQGLSMARNNGLKQATGEYILFLDSDDFIQPQLFEICYGLAEKEKAQLVCYSMFKENKGKTLDTFFRKKYSIKSLKYALTDTPLYYQKKRCKYKISVNACTKFYKKSLTKDLSFIPKIKMEDYPHTYAVLAKRPKTVILNIPLYYYTPNPNSISAEQIDVKTIQDYQTGLNFVIDIYKAASEKERKFVLHKLFPNMLKQQFNKILRSPKEMRVELFTAFAKELADFKEKGWLKPWGHKISRYIKYRRLIKGIQK